MSKRRAWQELSNFINTELPLTCRTEPSRIMHGTGLINCRTVSTFWDVSSATQHSGYANNSLLSSGAAAIKRTLGLPGFCYMGIEKQAVSTAEPGSNLLTEGEPSFLQQDLSIQFYSHG